MNLAGELVVGRSRLMSRLGMLRGLQLGDAVAGSRMRAEVLTLFPGLDRDRLRFYRASTLLRLCVVYSMRAAPEDLIESLLWQYNDVLRNWP